MRGVIIGLAAAVLIISGASHAQNAALLVRHRMPVTLAQRATAAAIDACLAQGHRVSAAVVDRDGGVQAVLRGDAAGIQTVQSATDKAITSAVYGVDSSVWVDRAARGEVISPLLNQLPHLLLARGGVTITIDGEVIGGIGVGGATSGENDEACARVGLELILKAVGRPKGS